MPRVLCSFIWYTIDGMVLKRRTRHALPIISHEFAETNCVIAYACTFRRLKFVEYGFHVIIMLKTLAQNTIMPCWHLYINYNIPMSYQLTLIT